MPEPIEEAMRVAFADNGWLLGSREIQHGIQFDLQQGVKVNLYRTGRFSFGGPSSTFKTEVESFVRSMLGGTAPPSRTGPSNALTTHTQHTHPEAERRVFVVYGHDTSARDELELILRRIRVNPIILQNIQGAGDTIIERLEALTNADFACVLLTPDDVGTAKTAPKELRPRARQNAILELGMVLSRLGRHRVAILVKGDDLEKPSDIDGLIYIPFNEEVKEVAGEIAKTLDEAGFRISIRDVIG